MELDAARADNEQLRKQGRQFLLHQRMVTDSSRRLNELNRSLSHNEAELMQSRLGSAELEARTHEAERRAARLTAENDKLKQDRERSSEEVVGMRIYLAEMEKEKRKNDALNKVQYSSMLPPSPH
jgi:hypothetical protein